ncbi:Amidase [Alternaria alternata]|nr:Amidase [Alternaria alternata]
MAIKRSEIASVARATNSRASQTPKLHWRCTKSMVYPFCRIYAESSHYVYTTPRLRSLSPHAIDMPSSPCTTRS